MLRNEPSSWYDEIRHAEEVRDKFLQGLDEEIEKYHGPYYRGDAKTGTNGDPENHAHEWQSLMVPELTAANPRVRVTTSRLGTMQDGALALQFALNRWIRSVKMKQLNTALATDYGFRWAIMHVMPGRALADDEQWKVPQGMPRASRISPFHFIWDPNAINREDWRFQGHVIRRDKEDLLAEAKAHPDRKWNRKAIEAMASSTGGGYGDSYRHRSDQKNLIDRNELVYYELWVPELQVDPNKGPKKGYNGSLITVGMKQSPGGTGEKSWYLREPRPFWGPPSGPYAFCGAHVVPDETAPLSPLISVRAQAEELNAHARAMSEAMAIYKKIVAVSSQDPDAQTKITESVHHGVYSFELPDLRNNVIELEFGGVTQHMLAHFETLKARLDRNSGIFEAQRGNVEGAGTATEVNYAASASTKRLGFFRDRFRSGILGGLEKVAWYLIADSDTKIPMGAEANQSFVAQESGEPGEAWWIGGDPVSDFDAYEFEIELYSMQRPAEMQNQVLVAAYDELVMQVAPMIPQLPHVNWKLYLEKKGNELGIHDFGSLIDLDVAAQLGARMMQQQFAEPQASQRTQPRLGSNLFGKDVATPAGKAAQPTQKREAASKILARGNGKASSGPQKSTVGGRPL